MLETPTRPNRFPLAPMALAAFALLAVAAGGASADDAKVEIEGRLWSPDLGGDLRVEEQGAGTVIALPEDLSIGDEEFAEVRLTFHTTRRSKIRFAYVPMEYHGDGILSRTIRFGGQTFAFSTRVVSDLELEYARAGWAWQFLSFSDGDFRLGPLIEIKAFRGDAAILGPDLSPPRSAAESFDAAFPSFGLALDAQPNRKVHVFVEASGIFGVKEGELLDAEAGVRFLPTRHLALLAGFRTLSVEAEEDDDFLDVDIDGIFFGLSLRL